MIDNKIKNIGGIHKKDEKIKTSRGKMHLLTTQLDSALFLDHSVHVAEDPIAVRAFASASQPSSGSWSGCLVSLRLPLSLFPLMSLCTLLAFAFAFLLLILLHFFVFALPLFLIPLIFSPVSV